jgi:hypothetical protein
MSCITKLLESGADCVNSQDKSSFVEGGGKYNGYEYLIVLNRHGYRCGYVAISEGHPLYELENTRDISLAMHWGCTFFEKQMTESECSDKWIGFDCGHYGDINDLNALEKRQGKLSENQRAGEFDDPESTVKYFGFVEGECKGIINQLNNEAILQEKQT